MPIVTNKLLFFFLAGAAAVDANQSLGSPHSSSRHSSSKGWCIHIEY